MPVCSDALFIHQTYDVGVIGHVDEGCFDRLRDGDVYINSIDSVLGPSHIENLGPTYPYHAADGKVYAGASTIRVSISEGKHRQVRKVFPSSLHTFFARTRCFLSSKHCLVWTTADDGTLQPYGG